MISKFPFIRNFINTQRIRIHNMALYINTDIISIFKIKLCQHVFMTTHIFVMMHINIQIIVINKILLIVIFRVTAWNMFKSKIYFIFFYITNISTRPNNYLLFSAGMKNNVVGLLNLRICFIYLILLKTNMYFSYFTFTFSTVYLWFFLNQEK